LLIPAGFAHGFQTLTDDAELLYLHSADYAPEHEGGLSVNDPRLAIAWPLPVNNLSARDSSHPALDQHFAGVRL
jgi:dTDP-4-dehydrorhamnose 3,5-epimerase